MIRRTYACISIAAVLLTVALAEAQQPAKIPRVGWLLFNSVNSVGNTENIAAFRQGLRELGYVEGKNIAIEFRSAEAKRERLPDLAADLVRIKVDVLLAGGGPGIRAAKQATNEIPIVMAQAGDPVSYGLVASLARPGGNITGLASSLPGLDGKRLELLKESFPAVTRVAILWDPGLAGSAITKKEIDAVAQSLAVKLQWVEIVNLEGVDKALAAVTQQGAGALFQVGFPLAQFRAKIFEFATKKRLPAIYADCGNVERGGLMCYAPKTVEQYYRAATYVDKILKGAKAAEIPVEQPKKFDFFINLKAAKQIGVTIPPNVLARADRVIR